MDYLTITLTDQEIGVVLDALHIAERNNDIFPARTISDFVSVRQSINADVVQIALGRWEHAMIHGTGA